MRSVSDASVADVSLLKPGILLVRFHHDARVEASHAEEIIATGQRLTGGDIHCNVIDARAVRYLSNAARERFGQQAGHGLIAVAIVVSTALQRTMANLYVMVGKPQCTTEVFTKYDAALHWIEQQLRNPARAVLSS